MSGIAYAIGEILVFLIIATVLGVLIGRAWPKRALAPQMPPDEKVRELETKGLILEGKLQGQSAELAQIKADLVAAQGRVALLDPGTTPIES